LKLVSRAPIHNQSDLTLKRHTCTSCFLNATASGNNAALVRKFLSVLPQFIYCYTNILRFWLFTCLPFYHNFSYHLS